MSTLPRQLFSSRKAQCSFRARICHRFRRFSPRSILSRNGHVRQVALLLRSVILLAVFATVEAHAQRLSGEEGRPYYVERFTPADYGQNEQNWGVVQDRRGRIFVANRLAVLEYDGSQWRSHQIPNRFARSLAVASDGAVCVGGVGEIGCLRPDSLGSLRYESLLPRLPEDERAFSDVWTTHSIGNAVLFQTFDRIMRWDGETVAIWRAAGRFHKAFLVGSRYFVRDEGHGLLEMRDDALVMALGGELFADERIDAMVPGGGDDIIVVSRSRGLLQWHGERLVALRSEVGNAIVGDRIYHGIGLTDTTFALGTTSGRVIIGHADGSVTTILGADIGLQPDELVLDLFQDSHGGLWLALDTGIMRVDAPTPLTLFDQAQGLEGVVYQIVGYERETFVATSQGLFRLQRARTGEGPARFVRGALDGDQVANRPRAPVALHLAENAFADTCSPPSTVTSTWPPRIIANEVALSKKVAPGIRLTGWPPALIRSWSNSASSVMMPP
jgi:hypothetical protein